MANHSEDDPFESVFLHAYPNPDRLGCPDRATLDKIARLKLPLDHPVFDHVTECSACFRDIKFVQGKRAQATRDIYTKLSVAAGIVAVVVAGLLAWHNHRLSSDLAASRRQRIEHEQQTTSLKQQLKNLEEQKARDQKITKINPADEPPEMVVSVMLWPGRDRGPGVQSEEDRILLPTKPSRVLLVFQFEQARFQKYEAILKTVDGVELRKMTGLRDHQLKRVGRAVSIALPSLIFANGNYVVDLVGFETNGERRTVEEYTFTVLHRDS